MDVVEAGGGGGGGVWISWLPSIRHWSVRFLITGVHVVVTFEGAKKIQDVLTVLEVRKKVHIIGPILAIYPKPLLLDVPC